MAIKIGTIPARSNNPGKEDQVPRYMRHSHCVYQLLMQIRPSVRSLSYKSQVVYMIRESLVSIE